MERFEALDINNRGLFTAIYGLNGSSEVFITSDLRIHNAREALYLYLKSQGFTVVYYDDKAFSYEEYPLLKFFNFNPKSQRKVDASVKRDFFKGKGPMSKSRNMGAVISPINTVINQPHHDAIQIESTGNQKRYIVNQSEGIFNDIFAYTQRCPEEKLAIVFVSPLTLTFDDNQRKVIINKWNEIKGNFNRNKLALRIITLYDVATSQSFSQSLDSATNELFYLSPFRESILNEISPNNNEKIARKSDSVVFYLGIPGRDEISYMLHYKRLMYEKGLPHLFSKIKWDYIVLRLWQGALSGENHLSLIKDFLKCHELDYIIEKMDSARAIDRLNALKGIDNIKTQFAQYRKALLAQRNASGSGKFRPHMVLMGSPGTGKSTVARLFGDILREDGLLPKGHFIKVSIDELIGQYIGETRPKTRAVCERARGGVLFIDEAYGLMSGKNTHGDVDYGGEAIEILIQFMEDNDDSLAIFAGYTDEMMNLLKHGNIGFSRRFNKLGIFEFKDYSSNVLYDISAQMIKVPTTDDFQKALKQIIHYKCLYRDKNFGNVGEMENLVNIITSYYASLNTHEPLDAKHLPDELKCMIDVSLFDTGAISKEFKDVLGQPEIKKMVNSIFSSVEADRIKMKSFPDYSPQILDLNYIFIGNPGTGKTSIAKKIGKLFQQYGIFPNSNGSIITEVTGNDLIATSSADIEKLFEDNIGKVLFIDEAYRLRESPRAVTDIVKDVDSESYKNKLSVIMAGYSKEMNELLKVNPGLSRRFKIVEFSDYTNEELYEILVGQVNSMPDIVMDVNACREVGVAYFASIPRGRNFGNAGESTNLLSILKENRDRRYVKASCEQQKNSDFAQRILPCDFPNANIL